MKLNRIKGKVREVKALLMWNVGRGMMLCSLEYTLKTGLIFVSHMFTIIFFGSFWINTTCAIFYGICYFLNKKYAKVARSVASC